MDKRVNSTASHKKTRPQGSADLRRERVAHHAPRLWISDLVNALQVAHFAAAIARNRESVRGLVGRRDVRRLPLALDEVAPDEVRNLQIFAAQKWVGTVSERFR